MKKIFLITSILLFIGNMMQAQQQISDENYVNLPTYGNKSDSLFNGHNYYYYNTKFKKATKLRNAGIFLSSAGVGLFIGSLLASGTNLNTTAILFFSSVATLSAGVPLWVAGGVKRKNNRKVMEQIKKNMSISFRTTHNGVGLVLNF